MLATAPDRTLSRHRVTGLLWPEKDDDQARRLLSVATYEIRRELGEETLLTRGDDVVLDPLIVRTDLEDFEAALDAGDLDAAIALHRGAFLDGFYLGSSSEFEQWMDGERNRTARRYRRALATHAERIEAAGDPLAAAEAWQKAANEDRFDSRIALRLLRALDAAGNRTGALQFARVHESLLQDEFGTAPDPAFTAAVEDIREGRVPPAPPPPAAAPAPRAPAVTDTGPGPTSDADAGAGAGADPAPPARRRFPAPSTIAAAILLLIAAAVVGYLASPNLRAADDGDGLRVAVLPFSHPDAADEAFADGLSEEIMNALAQVRGVQVPAWSAVATLREVGAREAAARLGADHIVEGRVRREGDSLRISVQLSGQDGFTTWTKAYDRSAGELFATWEEIALAVLDELEVELGARGIQDTGGGTRDIVAYDLFVKGRHAWFKRAPDGLGHAVAYFGQAIERDPDFARAYVGLADAYNIMGAYDYGVLRPDSAFPLALEFAERALDLAPRLGEAYAAKANTLFSYYRDAEGAERAYRRAIDYYPHYAEAHHWYSLLLVAQGRNDEAIREAERAIALDSLSPVMRASMARQLYFRGDPTGAIEGFRRALQIEPGFPTAQNGLGIALLELRRFDEAIAAFSGVIEAMGQPHPVSLALIANAHGQAGRPEEARRILTELEALREQGAWVPPDYFALVHLGLGDLDAAMAAIEAAADMGSTVVPFLAIEPLARPLWGDPRFQALLERGR